MFSKGKTKNTRVRKKNKVHLVFDECKRREFLTGFHKRKLERKKKAKEKFEKQFKEEKKRLKAQARESYKKLVKSYTPIPEIEHLVTKEYDDTEVNIQIAELSTNELTRTNDWIGANQPCYESDESEQNEEVEEDDTELLPGMEIDFKPAKSESQITEEPKSKKEIKKLIMKEATKNMQKSKTFRKKNRIEQHKQKLQAVLQKKQKHKKQRKKKL